MYKIELSDGTVLSNVNLNGNNYIPKKLDKKVFKDNLDKVLLTDSDGSIETLYNQKVQFAKIGNRESFIFLEKSKDEIEKEGLMLALAQLDIQREQDKTESQLALAELATMLMGGE